MFDLEVHMEVIVVYGRIEVPARDVTKTNRANSTIAAQVVEVLRGFLLQRDEGVVPAGEWRVMSEQGADGEGRMHARNGGSHSSSCSYLRSSSSGARRSSNCTSASARFSTPGAECKEVACSP